ncbi:MAG: type IV secretory system conjugative DNA transfer family protein [Nitrososphaera sp.]|nr:type IV secretory system conjugative DNA transfer family protein [Nitrososphaera sp.]
MSDFSLIPKLGEHVIVCGQNGSGKTVAMHRLALSMLELGPVVVVDTKDEPRYMKTHAKAVRAIEHTLSRSRARDKDPKIKVWKPDIETVASPELLDESLNHLYRRLRRGTVVIDELYPFHSGGRAGPGLTALLTRGRSRGITVLMGSQRPAWVSRFVFTEAKHYWIYKLIDRQDRKRLAEVIPGFAIDEILPRFHFRYYCSSSDFEAPLLFSPLKVGKEPPVPTNVVELVWV